MPFTLSHPAAALAVRPFLGRRAVLSALVIGSMAPDFPYLVSMGSVRVATHSLASVLWFALPSGWLVYMLWREFLRPAFLVTAPEAVAGRLPAAAPAARPLDVSLCLCLGALTHVLWDGLTHRDGLFVAQLPVLRAHLGQVIDYHLWTFKLLQHGSTLFGAAAVAAALRRWFLATRVESGGCAPSFSLCDDEPRRFMARAALVVVPAALALHSGFARLPDRVSLMQLAGFLGPTSIRYLAGVLGVAMVIGALQRAGFFEAKRSSPGNRASWQPR